LLVDFDLITNGASYFFLEDLQRQGKLGVMLTSHLDLILGPWIGRITSLL